MSEIYDPVKALQTGRLVVGPQAAITQAAVTSATEGVEGVTFRLGLDEIARESDYVAELLQKDWEAQREERIARLSEQNYHFLVSCTGSLELSLRRDDSRRTQLHYPRFSDQAVGFSRPEHWLVHRANTVFVVPPKSSRQGIEKLLASRMFSDGYKTKEIKRRPLPLWVVGVRPPSKEHSGYEYLGITPRRLAAAVTIKPDGERSAAQTEVKTTFAVARFATSRSLQGTALEPPEDDVLQAYNSTTRRYAFQQGLTHAEAPQYPRAGTFDLVDRVTDEDRVVFSVGSHLVKLMAAFNQLETYDECLEGYTVARQRIEACYSGGA